MKYGLCVAPLITAALAGSSPAQVLSDSGLYEFLGVDFDVQVQYELTAGSPPFGPLCQRTGTIPIEGLRFESQRLGFTIDCDDDVAFVEVSAAARMFEFDECDSGTILGGLSSYTGAMDDVGEQSGRATIRFRVRGFARTYGGDCNSRTQTRVEWDGSEGSATFRGPLNAPGIVPSVFQFSPAADTVYFGVPQDECGPVRVSTDPNGPINRDGYIPPGVYEVDIDVGAALSNFFGNEAAETAELFFYDGGWFPPDCLNLDRDGIGVFLLDAADVCAWFRSPTDTNADGAINDLDRQWLEYMVENQDFPPAVLFADVNGDWSLTPADFNAWIAAFNAGSQRADQNGDQLITPSDFNAWILNYNSQACGADV